MPSRNATIAEAVKSALNTAAATDTLFGAAFVATRVYSPTVEVSALPESEWTVTVFAPGESTDGKLDRARWNLDVPVVVAMDRRIPAGIDPSVATDNATLDALTATVEAVADFFHPRFSAADRGITRRATQLPTADALRSERRFLALITLYFAAAST